jgi:hypothetical protein
MTPTAMSLLDDVETATNNILRDKLKQIAKRKRNWDNQGGIPASREIMGNSVAFIEMIIAEYKPMPTRIWMTPLGEIVFVFYGEMWVRFEADNILAWGCGLNTGKKDEIFDRITLPTVFESL